MKTQLSESLDVATVNMVILFGYTRALLMATL